MDQGPGYKNDQACVTFIEYIAREFQQQIIASLNHSKFFSYRLMPVQIQEI